MSTPAQPVTIALDAMGGDECPHEPVRAAAQVTRETAIHVALVGDPERLRAELDQHDHRPERIRIVPAKHSIAMDEKPREALAAKPDASIAVATQLVAAGEAAAVVSAGSTGALVLAAATHIPRIPGIRRAALAAVYPTHQRSFSNDRFALILDVGATVHCTAEELLFFGYMGHAYARTVSKVPAPAIGLLNVGAEETKGDEMLTRAHELLASDKALNFIGNVEGTDIPKGIADVIVCEGLVGNVALKMAEGMSEVFASLGAWAFKQSLGWKIGLTLLSRGLRQLKNVTDYREYGGAPILGFRRIVIKAHGRSHARALANAIKVAAKAARGKVPEEIESAVVRFESSTSRR